MSFPINRAAAMLHAQHLKDLRDAINAFLQRYDPHSFMGGTSIYAHPRLGKSDLKPIIAELRQDGWCAQLRKEALPGKQRSYWIFIC